ncbi:hypothetical protein KP509_20G032500 [Ceratopteris richardii]|uniref:Chromo domain-containing protein n=1 Tax=Ceratopteris richardii TaxID=49495 RepID=A0A8T2SI50_CERRI|nr:hypothetical protein KP509_20G032500 [Ceratopteris richardii]
MLWAYVSENKTDWDSFLPLVEFSYNSWKHKTTRLAPFEFLTDMQANLKIAQFNLQQAAERMKAFVDRHRTPRIFQEGDRVFLHVPLGSSLTVDQKPKLSPRFCGPWTVIKKISDVSYKLQLLDNCKVHAVFHVSKLRPYISRDENCVDGLVALKIRASEPDVPFHILDKREQKLQNHSILEYLVAWTSYPLTDATWESTTLICEHFPSLIIEDKITRSTSINNIHYGPRRFKMVNGFCEKNKTYWNINIKGESDDIRKIKMKHMRRRST